MYCKDCVFFTKGSDLDSNECSSPKFVYSGDSGITETDQLGYWDQESYVAGFNVGEDFGCVHFKAK